MASCLCQVMQLYYLRVTDIVSEHIAHSGCAHCPHYAEAVTGVFLQKKVVLKIFAIFTGKHLYWSFFLVKGPRIKIHFFEIFSKF